MFAYKGMYRLKNGRYKSQMSTEEFEIGYWYVLDNKDRLELCGNGFHYCRNPMDVHHYFAHICDDKKFYEGTDKDVPVIMLIEVMGSTIDSNDINSGKSCTDCFRILYEYSIQDYDDMIRGVQAVRNANYRIGV